MPTLEQAVVRTSIPLRNLPDALRRFEVEQLRRREVIQAILAECDGFESVQLTDWRRRLLTLREMANGLANNPSMRQQVADLMAVVEFIEIIHAE